ncbi:MAG: M23 family metallopeptidase [Saprospiraceae bacterium]|nr:M23 family metallopeptidase [Anaerolineae bacterium]MCB0658934.1 M23 family metallopeptidase [Saprospiraceae bacterium]
MYSSRKFASYLLLITILLSGLVISATTASASKSKDDTIATNFDSSWAVYTDSRFDFSIKYPSDWNITPRDDSHGVGATLTFSQSAPSTVDNQTDLHNTLPKIQVGMYLIAWSDEHSLKEWTDQYNELGEVPGVDEINITQTHYIKVNRLDALYEIGQGEHTFRYVNIPRNEIVWFIWSNVEEDEDIAIYENLVNSLRFGKGTPNTLQEVYGSSFQPLSLNGFPDIPNESASSQQLQPFILPLAISSSWRSPFNGGPYNTRCDSAFHSGSSNFAIDIPRATGSVVVGSNTGAVTYAQWHSQYGNLVKAQTSNYEAYYAHLDSIDWWSLNANGWAVAKHGSVGTVGCTGQCTGPHLHFHVRDVNNNTAVDLTGMTIFTPTAGLYPESGNPCGTIRY